MSPPQPLRVCLYGLGAIGRAVARELLATPGVEVTGAVDSDPKKTGMDLRALLRLKEAPGAASVQVSDDARSALRQSSPHAVVHCTGSRLTDVAESLETIIDAGLHCVTSCEEMAYPEAVDPVLTGRLDRRAREAGVALLGAGVNPGFAMDTLVLALSGAARAVESISVERVLDPLSRRKQFQKKVGLGLEYRQAQTLVGKGLMGHIGLRQSALLIARGLSWNLSEIHEEIRVLCEGESLTRRPRRPPRPDARVIGLQQTLAARNGDAEVLRMEMVMAAGVEAPHDAVTITADPDLKLWIPGGIPGDQATVACLINALRQVVDPPRCGLLTILDLPLRTAWRPVNPS